jgi:excisionase family DNA binding protein
VQAARDEGVPHLLTITHAAKKLGIARGSLYKLIDTGSIGYVRVGADRRVPMSEIDEWIAHNTIKAGA